MLLALSLALVHGIILLPQENVLSGASDIGGMDRKLSAIRCSRGYRVHCSPGRLAPPLYRLYII